MTGSITEKHTVVNETINADSIEELNAKLADLGINERSSVAIRAEIWAINREIISQDASV